MPRPYADYFLEESWWPVTSIKSGARVRLSTPDNPRLDGALAVVKEVTEWGAHVMTAAAATGQYRAHWSEMEPIATLGREAGYEGDACDNCGEFKLRRNGSCLVCDNCGSTSGCS